MEPRNLTANRMHETPVDNFGPYPGYWTELVMLSNWPPDWHPATEWGASTEQYSEAVKRNRNSETASGFGSISWLG